MNICVIGGDLRTAELIKMLAKDENDSNVIKYANNKLIELSKDEEIIYIDLYNILKNNSQVFTSVDSHYPNIDGYKLISREIIEKIEKKVIKTLKEM